MWWAQLTVAILFISQIQGSLADKKVSSVYTAVGPKLVRPDTIYNVTIAVEKDATPMTFVLAIKSVLDERPPHIAFKQINQDGTESDMDPKAPEEKTLFSSEKTAIAPGEVATIQIKIGELPSEQNRFNLTVVAEAENGEVKYQDSSLVYKDTKQQSLLLQTDKPIYKPGETVNFRVVMLNRFLRPLTNQLVEISIIDPQQNLIKSWKDFKLEKGLLTSKLELSPEPNLGDWTLKATSNGQTEMLTFSVDQYILPKFKVDVILPAFITFNNSKFNAEIKAAYTYGKAMKGDVEVRISEYQTYRWGDPPKIVSKKSPIDGSVFIEFDPVKELEKEPLTYEKEYQVDATVTDSLTGRQQNGTARIRIHQYPYKIEMIEEPRNYKPGFPLQLTFKVTSQDGTPISDSNPKALKILHGFSFLAEDGILYHDIPANGIVRISLKTPTNELMSASSVELTYKELTQTFYPPQKLSSPSKTYMDVALSTKNPAVKSKLAVTVKLNKNFDSLSYILYGRGQILKTKRIILPAPAKEHKFELEVPSAAAPEASLLVYTVIKPTLELAVDTSKFTVNSVFDNYLNLTLSKEVAEPGENLSISMDTTAGSVIAVRGVDQSVLLLKEDKDITVKTIDDEVKSFQNQLNNYRMWGGSSAFQMFEETGLIILTNAVLEKERYVPRPFYASAGHPQAFHKVAVMQEMAFDGDIQPMSLQRSDFGGVNSGGAGVEPRVRTNFPETWLWQTIQTNASTYVLEKVVPDTLTSWVISGYSLSSETGIGISLRPSILKTFRPFFITLNKPYSIVKGEIFGLQVLVHNYMENEVTAGITLQNTELAFEFHQEENKNQPEVTKSVIVGPAQVKSVTFVIKPTKFGIIKLNVKGITPLAGDAVSQPLIVKPPGQKQSRNKAVLLDLRSVATVSAELKADFPPKRVEGADQVKISVISDLLGSTISNLDKLLQMPCGCGEQNMLNFVPDIVILEYLQAAGTLTPEIKKKAIRFLEAGYQRELTYRHHDGSFSAFGQSDSSGSTWLTAFVVRSFVAAKPHITIDSKIIREALQFLASKQQSDGSFVEHGTVIHSDMKGGAADSYSLSAYVLLAFVESGNFTEGSFEHIIKKGLEYVVKAPTNLDNPYPLTLISFVLQSTGHEQKGTFKVALEKLAKHDGDLLYWEPPKKEKPKADPAFPTYHWEPSTKPVSVEMTAYVLLIYLRENNLEKALSVGKWLLTQRNAEGGFISTQDTVVGLTALAKFALATRAPENDLGIKATYSGNSTDFKVSKDNSMVLQEVFLPGSTTAVQFKADGKGTALAQLSWTYYVEDKSEAPAFALDIKVDSAPKSATLKLTVCTAYTQVEGKNKESNMAVLEVNLPSGYAFDTEGLESVRSVNQVKRFDLENSDTKLNIYFNSIDAMSRCVTLPADRVFKVANPAPAYVDVYDYYDTTMRARSFYNPPGFSACDICNDDESCASQNCVN